MGMRKLTALLMSEKQHAGDDGPGRKEKLELLEANGSTEKAFTLKERFPPPR